MFHQHVLLASPPQKVKVSPVFFFSRLNNFVESYKLSFARQLWNFHTQENVNKCAPYFRMIHWDVLVIKDINEQQQLPKLDIITKLIILWRLSSWIFWINPGTYQYALKWAFIALLYTIVYYIEAMNHRNKTCWKLAWRKSLCFSCIGCTVCVEKSNHIRNLCIMFSCLYLNNQ